ncbi:MAG: hypothetical protein ACK45H_07045 [Bacteroidota bacterium]|jgi:O-antigen/teichoic acid export membrane protein
MNTLKIALISILFGAAFTVIWKLVGLETGAASGAGGAATALLFFGLYKRSKNN